MKGIFFGLQVCNEDAVMLNSFVSSLGIEAFQPEDMIMPVFHLRGKEIAHGEDYPKLDQPITLKVDNTFNCGIAFFTNHGLNINRGMAFNMIHSPEIISLRRATM
jgi:hypothetical protein